MVDALDRGRTSFRRRDWPDAVACLRQADATAELAPDDLERLAIASHMAGADDEAGIAWGRAHAGHVAAGEAEGAARCAFWVGFDLLLRGDGARAGGWMGRARRVLSEVGDDCVAAAYLQVVEAIAHLADGDVDGAHSTSERVLGMGTRFGDPDLVSLGLLGMGEARIHGHDASAGMALLDEAMVGVTAGEVSPLITGLVYCAVIQACHQAADLGRSRQWTDALSAWCASQPGMVRYRGQCLVHRIELMTWQGEWDAALAAVGEACSLLEGHPGVGAALYQEAEIHRMRGDGRAEDGYRRASMVGRTAQPGLALLRLDQGQVDAAAAAIRCARSTAGTPMERAELAAAAAAVLVEADALPEADAACQDLDALAAELDAPMLRAMAATARAEVHLADGDPSAALAAASRAMDGWRELDVPYELARAMALHGLAHRSRGDEASADVELDAARRRFVQLGAVPALLRLEGRVRGGREGAVAALSGREVEVLGLVASGRTNRDVAHALCISEHTVARHLQNIFAKLGVASRTAATRYAVEHHLV